ncbi:DNA polymerase epsilon subunit B [Sphaceloma murrayae]|uniref:MICOS complex subunit MIC12 n=1 Tax=Sphaceloma murrayae TaxID=2082308 RepID=A0A2K1QGK9_9PEZI|nr:DNA polymerase epsilon subunit B [Sphaceloma murrayae]
MGFTTGFLGGITLTTTVLYLSLAVHERTRLHQAQLLRQQALILNNVVSPAPPVAPSTSRTVTPGLQERLKERWNRELEGNVRKVYGVDWRAVREEMEDRVAGLWGRAMQGTREGIEEGKKVS